MFLQKFRSLLPRAWDAPGSSSLEYEAEVEITTEFVDLVIISLVVHIKINQALDSDP